MPKAAIEAVWDGPFRRYGPLEVEDAALEEDCPGCGAPLQRGQYVTHVVVATPAAADSLTVRTVVAHWDCRRLVRDART